MRSLLPRFLNWLKYSGQEGRLVRHHWLRPLSGLWGLLSFVRNKLYNWRWLPVHRVDACVVSVGNLVAGGSGKTPLIQMLARAIGPVAILSRGYRAKESGLLLGDELTMLQRHLPHARLYSGVDRVALARRAVADGATCLLLDDGLQYRRLHRDIELIIVDASNPYGYGAYLPRGLLRDSPRRLSEADALFINGEMELSGIGVRMAVQRVVDGEGREVPLQGRKVGAFCAIGAPRRFLDTLRAAGACVVDAWTLLDHDKPDPEELDRFAARCRKRGAEALVCTEKDGVKNPQTTLPLYVVQAELEIVRGRGLWEKLIEKIALTIDNKRSKQRGP